MPDYEETFQQEADELLSEMEAALLALAERPTDLGLVDRVFRAVHTLKGAAAMFGSEAMVGLAHELETVLDRVRDGGIEVDRDLVNLGLGTRDVLARLMEGTDPGPDGERLSEALQSRLPSDGSTPAPSVESAPRTFRIRFRPAPDLLINGTRPLLLLDELRAMGICDVQLRRERVPSLADMDPELCYLAWDLALTTDRDADAIRDVFIFAEDRCRVALTETDARGHVCQRLFFGRAESQAPPSEAEVCAAPAASPTPDSPPISPAREATDIAAPTPASVTSTDAVAAGGERATVRVPADRLDALVDLVGELVTVQAGLSRHACRDGHPELIRLAESVERLTADLRDTTIRVRMTPLETTFARLRRLIHDLSNTLGKPAVLDAAGGETELDKSVIEGLMDPLVHLLRNCLDHGVESPEIRAAAGKPAAARISIAAGHEGGNVVVRLADDGAGIDAAAVRERALAMGLLAEDARPDEAALFGLIFRPGFSTRETAGALSGRGVGLDVVRERIEALRGRIDVRSRAGEGTAFILTLPLTLAIIDGLLVQVADTRYVLPLDTVEMCLEDEGVNGDDTGSDHGMIRLRGEALARVRLRRLFHVNGGPPPAEQLVIVQAGDRRVALGVDEVLGDHQTVIKSLGPLYRRVRVFSGATVLDDGRVALILDPQRLVAIAEAEQFLGAEEVGSWLSPS